MHPKEPFITLASHIRVNEWVKVTQSGTTLCNPMNYTVHGILQARILEWVAFPFSRGSSQPRDRTQVWILYQLSYQESPRILEWVAYPFSKGSSWPRNWTGVSGIADGFFTSWTIREALSHIQAEPLMCPNDVLSFLWSPDSVIFH